MTNPIDSTEKLPASDALAERVRAAHRAFPSGVAVVAVADGGRPYGLAVNAFASVSLEPPLVLVCVKTTAQTHDRLYAAAHVGITFLAHDQAELAAAFARSGGDKFAGVAWTPGRHGAPLLDGAAAVLEVAVQRREAAGTHTIFVGEVLAADASGRPPLVYQGGAFFDGGRLVEAGAHGA